ncbi:MAG: PilZ domain-containing protein [Burkholderiaceae bacterium]
MSTVAATEQNAAPAAEAEEVAPRTTSRPGVIQLSIKEKPALIAAYMPFVKGGGLFVPTVRSASLGDPIYLVLTLMDDPNKLAITGKVIWITPPGVPGRQQGIGIQFADDETGEQARSKIETLVGGSLGPGRTTHTV